jgi:hypothetical protein
MPCTGDCADYPRVVVLVDSDRIDKLGVVADPSFVSWTRLNGLTHVSRSLISDSRRPQLEILALCHQVGVLQRSVKRPKLTPADRCLWAWLPSSWNGWESRVSLVKAATVIGWQCKGFGLL